jgi:ABC-2 type transport system permease protein
MQKLILKFIHLFDKVLEKQGLQLHALYAIVENKLLMDKRRVVNSFGNKKNKNNNAKQTVSLISYSIMGIFIGLLFFGGDDIKGLSFLFHTYLIVMMCMTLITDFAQVILDTTDNQILLPKPINSKTISFARLLHISIYLFQYTLAICLLPWIFCFINFGFFIGVGLIITSILTVLFALAFTYIIYMILLNTISLKRLNSIISNIQIVITIAFVALSQLLPRLVNFSAIGNTITPFQIYHYAIPSYWPSYILEAIYLKQFNITYVIMTLLAFGIPIILLNVITNKLSKNFTNILGKSADGISEKIPEKIGAVPKTNASNMSHKLSSLFIKGNIEAASFEFCWKMMGREKIFLMQFFSGLSMGFVFAIILMLKSIKSVNTIIPNLQITNYYLVFVYMPILGITSGYSLSKFSDNYEASWVFNALPITKPGQVIMGSFKVLLLKYFIPIYFFSYVLCLIIWGFKVTDDFALGFLLNVFVYQILIFTTDLFLPFSQKPSTIQQGGKFIKAIIGMVFIGFIVGLHYVCIHFNLPIWVGIILASIPVFFLQRKISGITWAKIKTQS